MALNLLTNPASVPGANSDFTNFVAREDVTNTGIGYSVTGFRLTEWDETSTVVPAVDIGSWIEVGGSIYQADSVTALTNDPSGLADGQCRIKLVVSGTTVVPTLTNDAMPAWDSEKHGWYDGGDKFLPYEMTRSGAVTKVYTNKFEYVILQNKLIKAYTTGALDLASSLDVGGSLSVSAGGSFGGNVEISGDISAENEAETNYISSTSATQADIYSMLSPMLPNVNDTIPVNGMWITSGGSEYKFLYAYRTSTTRINVFYYDGASFTGILQGVPSGGITISGTIMMSAGTVVANIS